MGRANQDQPSGSEKSTDSRRPAPSDASSSAGQEKRIRVRVNGREVWVPAASPDPVTGEPKPTTIMQACEAAGVYVPHFCYHPKLPPAGNCRMCLVECGAPALGPDRRPLIGADGKPIIRKSPRPVIACATPVTQDMEIYTETPAVRQMRRSALEFFLINHPLDCPICDQAGECLLQEYVFDYGLPESRFEETKLHKLKAVPLGPKIMLDRERCILCGRCVRFAQYVAGDDSLGFFRRGARSELGVYPGSSFDNNYALNTVDLCPVGALTSRDFRFRMRVWFLKETKSLCAGCGRGCNILVGSREGRIYRLTPRRNDAVNSCWMCDEGRLNYNWVHRPDRLAAPVLRKGGEVDWDGALDEILAVLRAAAPGAVAVIASARLSCEELFLARLLARRLEAMTDCVPRFGEEDHLLVTDDKNPNSNGARLVGMCFTEIGINLPVIAEAIERGKVRGLVVLGEDVTKEGLEPELLDRLDWLVASDVLPGPLVERADIALPGAAHFEKWGTFVNVEGRLQRFAPAIPPPGRARPEAEWLCLLVGRLTGRTFPSGPEALFDLMASEVPAFRGIRWRDLGDQGVEVEV